MSGVYIYAGNGTLVEEWNDETRVYTDYRPDPDSTRPYTAEENAEAEVRIANNAAQAEHEATEDRVRAIIDDLKLEKDKMQVVIDTDNAEINDSPAYHIKEVARSAKRISDACIDLAKYVNGD